MLLDEIDFKILEELENNARLPVQQIARNVGMKRTTTGYRLNKLLSNGILKFACIANVEVVEYQIPLGIGINVSPGKITSVAEQLVHLSEVKVLSLVAGRYVIFAWCLLKDRSDLNRFLQEGLGRVEDIISIETVFAYTWLRDSWRYFTSPSESPTEPSRTRLTDLDLSLIRALQEDPRQNVTSLAGASGCSTPVAKERLNALLENRTIQIVSIIDPSALGYHIEAMILVKTPPSQAYAIANQLSKCKFVRHVSLTTGNWQIFVSAQFRDAKHLHEFLTETLVVDTGVMEFKVLETLKTLKFSMMLVNMV